MGTAPGEGLSARCYFFFQGSGLVPSPSVPGSAPCCQPFLLLFLQPLPSGMKLLPEGCTASQPQHQEEPIHGAKKA